MSTTKAKARQSRTLFSREPKRGGSITVEWFGPDLSSEVGGAMGDIGLRVDLIDTVHITHAAGNRTTFRFKPGDNRVEMMLDACDVAFDKGRFSATSALR